MVIQTSGTMDYKEIMKLTRQIHRHLEQKLFRPLPFLFAPMNGSKFDLITPRQYAPALSLIQKRALIRLYKTH